jgi:hypothetical protein
MTDGDYEVPGAGWKNGLLISIGVVIGLVCGVNMDLANFHYPSIKGHPYLDNYLETMKYLHYVVLPCFPPMFGLFYDIWWPKSWWPKRDRQT